MVVAVAVDVNVLMSASKLQDNLPLNHDFWRPPVPRTKLPRSIEMLIKV